MKLRHTWCVTAPLLLLVAAWAAFAPGPAAAETRTDTFHVEGMTCGGCELGLEIRLRKLDGVERAEASYSEERVTVTYDPERLDRERIVAAIEELGYTARLEEAPAEGSASGRS